MTRGQRWGRVAVAALCVAVVTLGPGTGCKKREAPGQGALRLGYFPNVTHAQALVGVHQKAFAAALGDVPLEVKVFNAGPSAMEALLSGSLDATYVGAGPALNAYVRSGGELRIIAGAVDGGAGLYLREGADVKGLGGLKLASPQLGNSQDIALRHFLRQRLGARADDVAVVTVPNPEIVGLFARGEIDGAWVPEPWGSHLEAAGATLAVDESELWPEGRFHATVLVASRKALEEKRPQLEALVRAHAALTARWEADPAAFSQEVGDAFSAQVGAPLDEKVLARAFEHLRPSLRADARVLEEAAARSRAVGYLPEGTVAGITDASLLPPTREAEPGAPPAPGVGGAGE